MSRLRMVLGLACLLAFLLVAPAPAADLPPAHPPPDEPAARSPLEPLSPDHWSQSLLLAVTSTLEPGPDVASSPSPPRLPAATRWDAALLLARWLERGHPSGADAADTLTREYREELTALGLGAVRVRVLLSERRAAGLRGRDPWHYSPRRKRTLRLLDNTRSGLREMDRRLAELRNRLGRTTERTGRTEP